MPISAFISQIDQKGVPHWKRLYGDNYFTAEYQIQAARKDVNNIQEQIKLKGEYGEDKKERYVYITQSVFSSNLDSISTNLLRYAVHKRIEEDNPKYLLDALFTYGRLQYLKYAFAYVGYRKGNFYHIWDMLMALAGKDPAVIHAFLRQHPGPFTGHKISTSFISCFYFVLRDNHDHFEEAHDSLLRFQQYKKLPKYYSNIALILQGILEKNGAMTIEPLQYILDMNWRMRDNLPYNAVLVGEGISFYAHALYNLMHMMFEKHGVPIPKPPVHEAWDSDYNSYIHQPNHTPNLIIDFSQVSPILDGWLKTLPPSIDIFSI